MLMESILSHVRNWETLQPPTFLILQMQPATQNIRSYLDFQGDIQVASSHFLSSQFIVFCLCSP